MRSKKDPMQPIINRTKQKKRRSKNPLAAIKQQPIGSGYGSVFTEQFAMALTLTANQFK